jgi:uncharacterized low-complexity protein
MKSLLITSLVIAALVTAQLPASATDATPSKAGQPATQFITKGKNVSDGEVAALEAKVAASETKVSQQKGGEVSTEVAILAAIGALVLLGAILYGVNRNSQGE